MKKLQPSKTDLPLFLAVAGAGGFFLFLNLLTPMTADDYFYACRLGYAPDGSLAPVRRLQGIADILFSQKCVYLAHSGRIPVLATVQWFTLLPEPVFDLCNTLVFLLLLWQIAQLAGPRTASRRALTLLGAALLLWQCTPAFGQDLLWHTGAVNYLWTMAASLAFLCLCLQPVPGRGPGLLFALGLVSGWSMENQSAALCCLCALCLISQWRQAQCLPRGTAAGTAGQLLGFALLMLAPGNYRRSSGYGQSGLIPAELLSRLARYTRALWDECGGLILCALLLTLILLVLHRRSAALPLLLLAGAALCHFSMVLSPAYPLRSMFGTEVFLICTLLACLNRLDVRALLPLLCCLLGLAAAAVLPSALTDLAQLHTLTVTRGRYILEQRAQGNRVLTVPIAEPAATRFHPLWGDGLSDLMQDPANERNRALALYYDVDLIRGDPDL
ncbi:DUF6056 family protein [uncultured Gemmiger sp.]|uniref:DUF3329 domain-containing protein n=1 Tax=uncultured Gemmiger sp. TaxID=1623490 RepID=UPI0025FE1808|nr:DUF6056 family protein [uncultured Gemmiger sp.]